jgi:hypothetical protein
MKLTIHFHLVPRLTILEAVPPRGVSLSKGTTVPVPGPMMDIYGRGSEAIAVSSGTREPCVRLV